MEPQQKPHLPNKSAEHTKLQTNQDTLTQTTHPTSTEQLKTQTTKEKSPQHTYDTLLSLPHQKQPVTEQTQQSNTKQTIQTAIQKTEPKPHLEQFATLLQESTKTQASQYQLKHTIQPKTQLALVHLIQLNYH